MVDLEPMATEMILGFAGRYACLGDLDKWAASRLQVACKYVTVCRKWVISTLSGLLDLVYLSKWASPT